MKSLFFIGILFTLVACSSSQPTSPAGISEPRARLKANNQENINDDKSLGRHGRGALARESILDD